MDDVRVGLAGLGHRGLHWLRRLRQMEGYRVVAVCDPIAALRERGLAALDRRDGVAAYARYEDLLVDPKVDAIALCVRSLSQGAMAAQALEAGKHVNAEVPAAHTLEDCWRIVVAAERTGRVYQLAEQARYWGFVDAWRDLVAEGRLGRVTFCEGQYIGYYGTRQFFQDPETGHFYDVEELPAHPEARPTCLHVMPPIHYLPHELSPMLKVLDDRVVEVTAMSTGSPSYSHPEIGQPDIQVALMKTEKDVLLRMATGFTQPVSHARGHHWYQVMGTRGSVEWKRSGRGFPLMWTADSQMHDVAEMDWRYERTDAPQEARGSGHGDADHYVHTAFRDAVLGIKPLAFDVYRAMETAAPAILAADSIAQGTRLMRVPDFRPGVARLAGEMPR
ncbi:MAG: Gfo/Idh/MocA family oxidoreductase [Candidatus Latescibacteria bacterium]|nr:Gfo/Idh/MocA family oxidoreductase [Candidatus Latescibacterota bacterium]